MNEGQYIKLVEMLMEATSRGLLEWKHDTSDDVFYTTINQCRINVDAYYDSSIKDNSASLELFNSDGASFKTYLYSEIIDHDDYSRLKLLYEKVKDKYYRISESERNILEGLDALLNK